MTFVICYWQCRNVMDYCQLLINLKLCLKEYALVVSTSCRNLTVRRSRHCFIALSISCWSMLSHSSETHCLLIFFRKWHVYSNIVITSLHEEYLTDCVKIHHLQLTSSLMDIHWKFHKICPKTMTYIWKSKLLFTTQRSYASAVLGVVILSVSLSPCLSVTRVLCD